MGKPANDRLFPKILYSILQEAAERGFDDVVSWNPHGQSFKIHDRERFLNQVLVAYGIHQSKYKSLVRQLNLWGFQCIHGGKKNWERGSYYHDSFHRGEPDTVDTMRRCRIKGKNMRASAKRAVVVKTEQAPSDDDDDDSSEFIGAAFWEDDLLTTVDDSIPVNDVLSANFLCEPIGCALKEVNIASGSLFPDSILDLESILDCDLACEDMEDTHDEFFHAAIQAILSS